MNAYLLFRSIRRTIHRNDRNSNQDMYEWFYSKTIIEKNNNRYKLNPQKVISLNGDSVLLSDLLSDSRLIFRFSFLSCISCFDKELDIIISEIKNLSRLQNNIIILISDYNLESFIETKKKLVLANSDIPIFGINPGNFCIPLEESSIPYYFTIDSSLIINDVFIPMKEFPKLTLDYLKTLNEVF